MLLGAEPGLALAAREEKNSGLNADGASVYQQVGKTLIKHAASDFATVPGTGFDTSVSYEDGQAHSCSVSVKQGRKLTR